MSELLNSGKVGLTVFKNLAEQRKQIVNAWDESGLLEGLRGNQKANIAQLLENQAKQMLNEVTLDSSAGRFDTVAFPIVRRVFSRLLANEIVSVQPLALPSGLIFYMDARIAFNGADNTFGSDISRANEVTRMNQGKVPPYNTANNNTGGPTFASTTAYERFYRNDGWDYSYGTATTVNATTVIANLSAGITGGLSAATFDLGANFPANSEQSTASLRFIANQTIYVSSSTLANTTVVSAGSAIPFFSQVQNWTEAQYANGTARIVFDLRVADMIGSTSTYTYFTGAGQTVTITPTFETYDDLEAESAMGEITIRFSSITVNTVTRKLRAHWTPELAQDLEAYHSIDAEAELTALLSENIAAEIDREIIRDIIQGAAFRAAWDYAGLRNNANFFGTQKDWNQTLITRINEISAQIHKSTLRGGANWVVCSAEAGAIFDDLEYFHVDGSASPEVEKYNLGIEKIGNLGNRYVVYKDPYMPANIVLLGHKGNTFLEAGYVYAPYIPLQLTQTIYDPNDFTPRKGIMTRYAKKMINNRFYGVVYIHNINTY